MVTLLMTMTLSLQAESKAPEVLATFLKKEEPVAGEICIVQPPEEIQKYILKVQEAAKADIEWYKEFAKTVSPGIPLPWHEKLGLTKEEYEDYLELWNQREYQVVQKVSIRLEEAKPGEWMIRVSGPGMVVSLLRFNAESGNFKSPNGELVRIEDVDADAQTILGAWKGKEWKYSEQTDFISTKENFALGKLEKTNHCILIYRLQESTKEMNLADKSMLIRFTPPKK